MSERHLPFISIKKRTAINTQLTVLEFWAIAINDDRVLQLTQKILLGVKIEGHHFSASKFLIQPMDHGWMADQGSGISSDLVVVVSYSSNLFLDILLKRGCGGGRGW